MKTFLAYLLAKFKEEIADCFFADVWRSFQILRHASGIHGGKLSIEHGISSDELTSAIENLKVRFSHIGGARQACRKASGIWRRALQLHKRVHIFGQLYQRRRVHLKN
jgi:hypothetical protein